MFRIGSDEALKGDTFGGIVVAAVKASDQQRMQLEQIGVKDSKRMTDHKCMILAEKIRGIAKVAVANMMPEQYNREAAALGLTEVLNKLHAKVIQQLGPADEIIVDQYPGCKIEGAKSFVQAEDKYPEVAAASIIARAEALRQMQELSLLAGFKLPLGSTHVLEALIKIRDSKKDLSKFAKTSFRNVRELMRFEAMKK
jgi:ribonuclease HIII